MNRINCWNDTLQRANNILKEPPQSIKIKYDSNFIYNKKYEKSNIKLFDIDAIDCCLTYASNNETLDKTLILNLADDNFPGGCVALGSGAQEEALFRRTNYCRSLKIEFYPLKKDEIVYSPGISVIKTDEKSGWQLIQNPPKISFIACPGIRNPDVITNENGEQRLNNEDIEILKNKIKTIVQCAAKYNYETIIFGALGCGAWKNPVKHVAEIFKEVLNELDGVILNYYFAIMSTTSDNYIVRNRDNKRNSIDIFNEVFIKKI